MHPPGYNIWHKGKSTLPAKRTYLIAQDAGPGGHKRYMACDSYQYMVGRLSDISNGYEVIESMSSPVWLFCEYDGDKGVIRFADSQVRVALSQLVRAVLHEEYGITGVSEFCSTATTTTKTSLHFKMAVVFADMHGLKDFMIKVINKAIKDSISEFISIDGKRECLIDASVYSNFRCYRCVGMEKYGKDNELKCMDGHDREQHYVRYFPESPTAMEDVVPRLGPSDQRVNTPSRLARLISPLGHADGDTGSAALARYSDYINSYECIVDKLGAKVRVSRITSQSENITCCSIEKNFLHVCPYAGRTHDSNNLYVIVDMGKKTVSVRCHDEDCKGRKDLVARAYDNTDSYDQRDVTSMHSQEGNIRWSEYYDEPEMRDYPVHALVCVRAGMGTGKTQALKRLARTFDSETKALIVTHSRALASRMHAEFEEFGFVHYEKESGELVDAKVVVCLDSIARVKTKNFNYVFIDEAVSLFLHLNSPLMGNKTSLVLSVLEMSIIQAKQVYFLDACMDHTFGKSVVDYFADQKGCTAYWIRNEYVRPTNRKMFVDIVPMQGANIVSKSSQLSRAVNKVMALLQAGKNVVVCSSSKSFTVRLKNYVLDMRPDTRMIVYNSDTNEKLDNVAEYWKTCQLLVYSPTITAGVSFEASHFDSLVAFVSNSQNSPTVDITLQQLFRVRNLNDGDMHLFVHQMACDPDSEDAIQYPVSREEIVKFLQDDISLASKYFSIHKVNVQSVYRPSKDRVLEYDADRLSFLVIVGILMMRNRSTMHFSTLLTDTLHFDYGIPCEVMNEELPALDRTQLDMLRAAPSKLPAVPFEDVLSALPLIGDPGVAKGMDKRVAQATRRLVEYMRTRWHLPAGLEEDALRSFYEKTASSDAQDLFHKAQRFVALCDKTLEENRDDFSRSIHHTLDSADPNVVLFKRRMHAYHMKIVLGRQYLEALLKDGVSSIKRHEQVEVPESLCEKTYTEMLSNMSESEVRQFNTLFDIKQPTGLMLAKWILGGAFGIDVRRRDKKPGRTNFDQILLRESYLRDMAQEYGANIRNNAACMFKAVMSA